MRPFIIFDTETTGVTAQDTPCQIAAVLVHPTDFSVLDSFSTLIDPQREIAPQAQAVHGISREQTQFSPTLEAVFKTTLSEMFAQADIVCGHNVRFDIRMCTPAYDFARFKVLDTLTLARCRYPKLSNHKLSYLVQQLNLPPHPAHDAMGDVLSCLEFLNHIRGEADVADLQQEAAGCLKATNKAILEKLDLKR